jgi:hypothetical protein
MPPQTTTNEQTLIPQDYIEPEQVPMINHSYPEKIYYRGIDAAKKDRLNSSILYDNDDPVFIAQVWDLIDSSLWRELKDYEPQFNVSLEICFDDFMEGYYTLTPADTIMFYQYTEDMCAWFINYPELIRPFAINALSEANGIAYFELPAGTYDAVVDLFQSQEDKKAVINDIKMFMDQLLQSEHVEFLFPDEIRGHKYKIDSNTYNSLCADLLSLINEENFRLIPAFPGISTDFRPIIIESNSNDYTSITIDTGSDYTECVMRGMIFHYKAPEDIRMQILALATKYTEIFYEVE